MSSRHSRFSSQPDVLRPNLAARDIEGLTNQDKISGLEERQVGVDSTDFCDGHLQELEPRLRPRLVVRLLDQAIQLGITHGRSVEAAEPSERITAVDDGIEQRRGVGDREVPGEEKELVFGRFDSAIEGLVLMKLGFDDNPDLRQRVGKRSDD